MSITFDYVFPGNKSCFILSEKYMYVCIYLYTSVQFSSVTQSCPILYDPMDCSTPGFHVLHCFPEFARIHVH